MRFVIRDPKKPVPDLPVTAPLQQTISEDVLLPLHKGCCVSAPPGPAASENSICLFLTVVHFRKVSICRKVGSGRNGHPVI
jgi:hypothetical protein